MVVAPQGAGPAIAPLDLWSPDFRRLGWSQQILCLRCRLVGLAAWQRARDFAVDDDATARSYVCRTATLLESLFHRCP